VPILKLIFLFCFLVFLLRRWSLGHALFLASVLGGLIQGLTPWQIGISFVNALSNPQNLLLSCIILSILIFAHSLSKTGYIKRVIETYQGILPWPQPNLMMLPSLIGLLPMPGGAIFSAPLVKSLGQPLGISSTQLALINYWFRHTWEYTWPLYPGLILAIHLGRVDLLKLILIDMPITLLAFSLGFVFFLKPVKEEMQRHKRNVLGFLKEIAPILVVILLTICGRLIFHFFPEEITIGLAVWIGIIWVWLRQKITWSQLLTILKDKTLLKVLYAVLAIFFFKQILTDSQIVLDASKMLITYHVPLALIAAGLPFLVGLIVGLTLAFVGSTFPLIFSLLEVAHVPILPYIMLAFCSGIVGVLLSPMHLCLVLSIEYFQVEFGKTYRQLYLPCVLMLLGIVTWFAILRYLC